MVQLSDQERFGVTVHMDYAFMAAEEAEDNMQPTVVIHDDDKKPMSALAVEQKGVTEGIVRYVVGAWTSRGTRARS